MQKDILSKNRKKRIALTLVSILAIALLYITFRLTVGGYIIERINRYISNSFSKSSGTALSEISIANNSIYDQKSSLTAVGNLQLTGTTGIETTNPKIIAMEKFLIDYNSPMYPYAKNFVLQAQKYRLDWRLVASISGVESGFGTVVPGKVNNAWGWKGGPNGTYSEFSTWGDGITTVTQGLANGYGITLTPFDIEVSYCPPCHANPTHSWANGVVKYMNELSYYLSNLDNI
ncbi:hypothetical protein M0R04_00515 [Candidatus Dojkabacteria bacterium]|jgi:hypothetical protein|nr:hypothetical protein [Candidatus Dojkabacteria bacterium]